MHILLFTITLMTAFSMSQSALAMKNNQVLNVDSAYDHVVMPELFSSSVLIDDDETPPIEPNISKVVFLKLPPVTSLDERVNRLIQGIKSDITPEYDHFGHEIRRYMARVGNIKIFEGDEYLIQQVKNVRKAIIIADYWKKYLEQEIKEISEIIEDDESVSFAARTALKQNQVTTRTFLISLKSWLSTNERVLMGFLEISSDGYELLYPEILVSSSQDRLNIYNNIMSRQIKLKEIKAYTPFVMMAY